MKDKSRTLPPSLSHTHKHYVLHVRLVKVVPFAPPNLVHATTGAQAPDLRLDPRRRGVVGRLQGQRVSNARDAPSRGRRVGGSMFYFRLFHPSFHLRQYTEIFPQVLFFFSKDYRWPGISDLWIFYSVYDFLSCSQDRGERPVEQQHYQYNATGWQAQVCEVLKAAGPERTSSDASVVDETPLGGE